MRRGIPVRRSRAASWARLAGGLALPVLALGVAGTRSGMVPQVAVEPVLVAGFLLGLAALGLAFYSLADIWNSGAEGAWIAIVGIAYASPVLVILGLIAAAAIAYPRLTDIATDVDDPPPFTAPGAPQGVFDAGRVELQREAYPEIVPHVYPVALAETYLAVRHLMDTRRWMVTRDVHPLDPLSDSAGVATGQTLAEDDELIQALAVKNTMTQSRSGAATETRVDKAPRVTGPAAADAAVLEALASPPVPDDEATLEAQAPTPVFGFLDEVAIRLRVVPDGTQVDMRSASRFGEHDLGENARRISKFFSDLDAVLQPDPAAAATQ